MKVLLATLELTPSFTAIAFTVVVSSNGMLPLMKTFIFLFFCDGNSAQSTKKADPTEVESAL
jgi:hypothetical protein